MLFVEALISQPKAKMPYAETQRVVRGLTGQEAFLSSREEAKRIFEQKAGCKRERERESERERKVMISLTVSTHLKLELYLYFLLSHPVMGENDLGNIP